MIKINLSALVGVGTDYHQLGLFSNVQNFGSGWRVAFDHGDFLIIEGKTADGVMRSANILASCVTR